MSKHTPGPWRANIEGKYSSEVLASDGNYVCQLWGKDEEDFREREETKANARLIAAAPDGLKAVEMAYLHILRTPHDRLRVEGQSTLCALRDFIAVATGRTDEEVQNEFEA